MDRHTHQCVADAGRAFMHAAKRQVSLSLATWVSLGVRPLAQKLTLGPRPHPNLLHLHNSGISRPAQTKPKSLCEMLSQTLLCSWPLSVNQIA